MPAIVTALPLSLLPDTAEVGPQGHLIIGGCDVVELAEEYGTPLFVYDEEHLRERCRQAVAAFPDGVAYAGKAFLCDAMARLVHEEGMGLDVATGGELHLALRAGVPGSQLVMHGNNKSEAELRAAIAAGVGRLVVDSFDEMDRLEAIVTGDPLPVLVRVNPGVDAHTHEYLQTGSADSKFGFSLAAGVADAAIARVRTSAAMSFMGIHAHVGSQVFVIDSFTRAIGALAPIVIASGADEFSVGGGLGVAYIEGEQAPSIAQWANAIKQACTDFGVTARITAEPGRAIAAAAAVTVYRVGTIKEVPGGRTYLAVDGGMSDNPRPVLYGSGYAAFAPAAAGADRARGVRIVGKHCESGDVIVHEARVPAELAVGDLVATPVTGAYGHSMGSNYNMVLRPPVLFAGNGDARLVVRRETYDDLTTRDIRPGD